MVKPALSRELHINSCQLSGWLIQAYLLGTAKLFCSPWYLTVPLFTLHPILCPLFYNTISSDKWQPSIPHLHRAPYNVSVYNIHIRRYTINDSLTRKRCDLGRQELRKQRYFCFMIDTRQWIEFSKFIKFSGFSKMLKYKDLKLFLLLLKKKSHQLLALQFAKYNVLCYLYNNICICLFILFLFRLTK